MLVDARLAPRTAEEHVDEPGQDRHTAQEQRAHQGDARHDLLQVTLGVDARPDARDKPTLALQRFSQVLLPEDHVRVEVRERDDQDKVQDPVRPAIPVEEAVHRVRERRDELIRRVHEIAGDRAREDQEAAGEDQRDHARRVDAERDVRALPTDHHHAIAAHRAYTLAVLHRDAPLPFLHQDDHRHRQDSDDGRTRSTGGCRPAPRSAGCSPASEPRSHRR